MFGNQITLSNDFKEVKKALSNYSLILDKVNQIKRKCTEQKQNECIFILNRYSIKKVCIKKINLMVKSLIQRNILYIDKSNINHFFDLSDSKILACYVGRQLNMFLLRK